MSEQQRNYEQQQTSPERQAQSAKEQLSQVDKPEKINWNLDKSWASLRATLSNAWVNVDKNWNTNINGVNYNIKDLTTRDAIWQPDKMVIADKSWMTLTIVDKVKPTINIPNDTGNVSYVSPNTQPQSQINVDQAKNNLQAINEMKMWNAINALNKLTQSWFINLFTVNKLINDISKISQHDQTPIGNLDFNSKQNLVKNLLQFEPNFQKLNNVDKTWLWQKAMNSLNNVNNLWKLAWAVKQIRSNLLW